MCAFTLQRKKFISNFKNSYSLKKLEKVNSIPINISSGTRKINTPSFLFSQRMEDA